MMSFNEVEPIAVLEVAPVEGPDRIVVKGGKRLRVWDADLGYATILDDDAERAAHILAALPAEQKELFVIGLILGARASG